VTPRTWSRRQTRALAGAAVAAVLLTACSSGGSKRPEQAGPTTTTSTAPTTTTTTLDPQAAAVAGYRAFWQTFLAAADPMNPEDPRLAEHATGEELVSVHSSFLAAKAAGNVIRGTFDLAPTVVNADATTVVLRDCYGDETGVYSAATGARQDKNDPRRHLVTVTMKFVDGAWKVASVKHEGDGCTAS
jgi:ABC-type transport system substrate-binding protein